MTFSETLHFVAGLQIGMILILIPWLISDFIEERRRHRKGDSGP